jgi:predicted enzyme related to lactoylglutathione lyase
MKHAIAWFDIQVRDIEMVKTFYSTVLGTDMIEPTDVPPEMGAMVYFPYENGVGGSLTHTPDVEAGSKAVVVYLDAGDDLQPMLDRVEGAGGKVTGEKMQIPDGFIAHFEDPEGNLMGLFSVN